MNAKLIMFREDGERRDFPITPPAVTVGRKNDCDIRIPLAEVSRRHVEFRVESNSIMVKDLGSANGTFVNNKRVNEASLSPGDHVIIGPVVFTLQVDGKPAEIRPVKTKVRRREMAAGEKAASGSRMAPAPMTASIDDELDPISALEALASSADQTAIDPLDEDDVLH